MDGLSVLVTLRNLTLETQEIYALWTNQDTKVPEHYVYVRDKSFKLEPDEFSALTSVLKAKDLMRGETSWLAATRTATYSP